MASVLRERFGAFRRTVLPSTSQHPVQSSSMIAKRFMGGHGADDAGKDLMALTSSTHVYGSLCLLTVKMVEHACSS
jgi:hypothetical protein